MTTALALYGAVAATLALALALRSPTAKGAASAHPPASGLDVGSLAPSLPPHISLSTTRHSSPSLLLFSSTTCPGCLSSLPRLVGYLESSQIPAHEVLAVVVGPETPIGKKLQDSLSTYATVVCEEDFGPISQSYDVQMFPSYVVVRRGRVVVNAHSPEELSASLVGSDVAM